MRIVEYLHTTGGGHLAYTSELVHGLREAGADVFLMTGVGAPAGEGVIAEIPTPNTALRSGTPAWVLDRLRVYAGQAKATERALAPLEDVDGRWLHCQQLPTLFPRRFVQTMQKRGWKVAITVHNVVPHSDGFLETRSQRGMEAAWRKADALIVHSHGLRTKLIDRLGPDVSPLAHVVAHPVWSEETSDAVPTRDFLFFGHLRPNKGAESFLDAMAILNTRTATVAGSGSPERVQELRERMSALGLANVELRAEFIPDEEIATLFADHRVVVAPYKDFEAQSGVTHLAVAHARPIVVNDVGALRDLVDDFALGEVVEHGQELASRMEQAVERAAVGQYRDGLARARHDLSPLSVGERLIQVFKGSA